MECSVSDLFRSSRVDEYTEMSRHHRSLSQRRALYRVSTVSKAKRILESIEEGEREDFITSRDKAGRTALFYVTSADICKFLIESVTCLERRDQFIRTEDNQETTALHWSRDGDIATILMNGTADDQSKLEFVLHQDCRGYTAAMGTDSCETLRAIFQECDDDTVTYLLQLKNNRDENLVQRFGMKCYMDHLAVIEDYLSVCDVEKTIMATDNQGNTPIVYMVIGQNNSCLAETLKLLSLEQKRRAMSWRNKLATTVRQILLVHPHRLRDRFENYARNYQYAGYQEWEKHLTSLHGISRETVQIVHFMLNEYSLDSPGTMISARLSDRQHQIMGNMILWENGIFPQVSHASAEPESGMSDVNEHMCGDNILTAYVREHAKKLEKEYNLGNFVFLLIRNCYSWRELISPASVIDELAVKRLRGLPKVRTTFSPLF